jgi:hypothetical protein
LFVALGGSSYAAVTLRRNSVKGKHIAPNAVTSRKVKDRSLRAKDFATGHCSVPIMTGVDIRSCNSGDATATISPGSELSLKLFVNGGGGTIAGKLRFGWRALTP